MPRRYAQLALVALLAVRLTWNLASGAGMFWDFINFYGAGRRIFNGDFASLYQAPAPIRDEPPIGPGRLDYVGFPISAFVFAPLGGLQPKAALATFKTACALFFGLGLLVLYRYCRDRFGDLWLGDASSSLYLLLILLFAPIWFVFVIGGQATPLIFMLLAILISAYTAGRLWLSAVCISIGILLKPVLALMALIFLVAGAWPLLARLAACLIAEGALSWLVFGWRPHREWLEMVAQESTRWAIPWWNNSSILGAAATFWIPKDDGQFGLLTAPPAFGMVQIAFRVLLTLQFVWLIMRARRRDATTADRRQHQVCLAILFPLFFPSVVWPHYLAIVFLPLMVLLGHYARLPRTGRVLVVLTLMTTARAHLPLVVWLYEAVPTASYFGILAAGFLGSGTLILMLVLTVAHGDFFGARAAQRPTRPM